MLKILLMSLILSFGFISCKSKAKKDDAQVEVEKTETGEMGVIQPDGQGSQGALAFEDNSELSGSILNDGSTLSTPVIMAAETSALEKVSFSLNQSKLSQETQSILNQHANWLLQNPGKMVQVEGHCDYRGSSAYNIGLGERRAKSVKNYLIALGVSSSQLNVVSYGEEKPLVASAEEWALAQNRRVEFVILN